MTGEWERHIEAAWKRMQWMVMRRVIKSGVPLSGERNLCNIRSLEDKAR
jgi:hypothetical protein